MLLTRLSAPSMKPAASPAPGMVLARRAGPALSPARLGQIAGALAAQPGRWGELLRFDAERRWYRRLELADDHEVWLLTWLPGQGTGFHDHGHAAGAFAVARGRVSERTVSDPGHRVRSRSVCAGSVRPFGTGHVHDVINLSGEPALSVHAYSPPLTAMRRYDLTPAGLVPAATQSAEQAW
jgi:predicted metal-dependent enzyme (double-stranded beta helix superfamily)